MIRPLSSDDSELTLHHGYQTEQHQIRRIPPTESLRMLGVQLNPMGHFGDHVKFLKEKADTFASRILSPQLTVTDVQVFHRSIYIPSMRYSLSSLAINEECMATVQSRIIPAILQKLHVNRHLPTSIRHGPSEMGGLDLYDLRTEAGLEAIKFFRNAIYSESENGKLLRLSLESSQLESGLGVPLLENPQLYVSYLTPTWTMSLRQFLSNHNITISLTDPVSFPLRSSTDQYIMQNTHLMRYTPIQLRDLNLVRLYLQVFTLADMADPSRPNAILLDYLDAKRPSTWQSKSAWPRQSAPTPSQRRLWKRFLVSSYLRYLPFWVTPPGLSTPQSIPSPSVPPTSHQTFAAYLATLPRFQRRLLDGYQQIGTDRQLLNALRSKARLSLASDGGLSGAKGTHGWVLSNGSDIILQCSGPVDGPADTASSTRSELAGCASALLLLVSLTRYWGLKFRCKFNWYPDSRAAISRLNRFSRRGSIRTRMPHDVDLLSLIADLLREIGRPFRARWVKGHQDRTISTTLSHAAALNILADSLATAYRNSGRLSSMHRLDHQSSQKCSITLGGFRLTSQFDECIRYHINGYHLRQYIQQKYGRDDKVWDDVDFGNFGKHFRRLRSTHRIQHMKFVHDQLPLGDRRFLQAAIPNETLKICPCCKSHTETPAHFLQCSHNPAHRTLRKTLQTTICNKGIHPLRYLVSQGIEHYLSGATSIFSPPIHQYPPHLQSIIITALKAQARIGWDAVTRGFLSKQWVCLASYDMHDPRKHDRQMGEQRIRDILSKLHLFTLSLWQERNSVLHNREDTDLRLIRSSELAEIRQFHENPSLLCLADRHFCERSLERLLQSSASTRRRWLRRVKKSAASHLRDGQRQSLLTSFFNCS